MQVTLNLIIMAVLYVVAGANHFIFTDYYRSLMPPYIPAHQLMIVLSGLAEMALGTLLFFKSTRCAAAWGVILLLIAVLPVHIYMWQERHTVFTQYPKVFLIARVPLQIGLMIWAYQYTKT
jgi:uncharacterized membrane protein